MQTTWIQRRSGEPRFIVPKMSQTPVIDRMLLLGPQSMGQSRLELLPVELIRGIIPHLPVDARSCLGTASRTMLWKMGCEHWRLLRFMRRFKPERFLAYLRSLQRDRPLYYTCSKCLELHHVDGDEHTAPYLSYRRKIRDGRDGQHRRLLLGGDVRYCVYSYHIEKIIALHQNSRPLDTLFHACTRSWVWPDCIGTILFHTEARIVMDHLLLRTQQFINLGPNPPSERSIRHARRKFQEAVCPHFVACYRNLGDENFHWPWMGLFHWESCRCGEFGAICLCPCCPTEVRVDFMINWPQYMVVVTQWKDLGDVTMPEDQIWRAHSTEYVDNSVAIPEFRDWAWSIEREDLKAIRVRYENHPGLRAEDLLIRHSITLLRQLQAQGHQMAFQLPQAPGHRTLFQAIQMLLATGYNL